MTSSFALSLSVACIQPGILYCIFLRAHIVYLCGDCGVLLSLGVKMGLFGYVSAIRHE